MSIQTEKTKIIVVGFIKEISDGILPKLVVHLILRYYHPYNVIPCFISDSLDMSTPDIKFTNIFVNNTDVYYIDTKLQLYISKVPKNKPGKMKKCDIFINDKKPSIISHGLTNVHDKWMSNSWVYTIGNELFQMNAEMPELYPFDSNIIQIECGLTHVLFLTSIGAVHGRGWYITRVFKDRGINQIFDQNYGIRIGCTESTCFVLNHNNELLSFGDPQYGLLGRNNGNWISKIDGDFNIQTFSCGAFHVICLTDSNKICVFGFNGYGQLGLNRMDTARIKTPLIPPMNAYIHGNITDIQCGNHHTIISTSKGYYSFGFNHKRQLLIDRNNEYIDNPTLIEFKHIKKMTKLDGNIINIIPGYNRTYILQKG